MAFTIRKMVEQDTNQVFPLMQKLAVFEHYIDSFAITPEVVIESGFRKSPPDFYCLVAENKSKIVGMLVYYFLPYTAQNRPAIYMKELYVDETARNQKIGEALMQALKNEAKANNCSTIKWTVAPWNEAGIRFYHRLGAKENNDWLNYELQVK
ncbi:diamine acetyltransferase [Mannheimia granulomatis]|uniref:Diamine acetyltransferase n=1 Tax=Mannheimia granulomatis TaxID=85402 RepID=A0A011MI77_9PAST|nr:GNAT family N-acetyltransferase [Mannheimia granulomatis]EXI62191.1 diamine acetyltransferase [Mannheimia granulomatis]RGE47386.1 diamine acetyltransferase [Mannheimia granulomatis]